MGRLQGESSPHFLEFFESAVLGLIFGNAVVMCFEYCGLAEGTEDILSAVNAIFIVIFTIELCIRMTALFPKTYFQNGWNIFDFVIVVGSWIALLPIDVGSVQVLRPFHLTLTLTLALTLSLALTLTLTLVQALRPFRLFLLLRSIRGSKNLKLMAGTLLSSIPAMLNVSCLLFLAFFIFSGTHLSDTYMYLAPI